MVIEYLPQNVYLEMIVGRRNFYNINKAEKKKPSLFSTWPQLLSLDMEQSLFLQQHWKLYVMCFAALC